MSNPESLKVDSSYLCIACRSKNFQSVGSAKIIDPTSADEFLILSCTNCLHWITSPLPSASELADLYSVGSLKVLGEGWAHTYANGEVISTVAPDNNWVVEGTRDLNPNNFLEIGPGDGSLIRKFRQLSWFAFGVDPGQYLPDESIVKSAQDLPVNKKFQIIVLQDVLEHTSNPWEELIQYKKYLEPGTRVYMTFPWSESKEAQKLGANWAMVRPVGHLHYFSKASARSLLASIGAELVSVRIVNLMPSKTKRIKNLLWLLMTFPLQYFRRGVRKNPYRQRLSLLWQSYISFRSEGDQLYVEGVVN